MKKVVIEKAGGYDQLRVKEEPNPEPGFGEVLIAVRAAGINFADCCVRMGVYQSAKEFVGWPITPGFEVAGVITKVGEGVSSFSVGDQVIAVTRFGGYTSHLVSHEKWVFRSPENLSFSQGASVPAVFLTAFYALFELVHPHPTDCLLIHSAAGGVGSSLVQLSKWAGCKVVGVVGTKEKVDFVKALGADFVIDKSHEDLWKVAENFSPDGYDAILDANGPATLKESYRHLALGGKLVVYGFHTMLSKERGTPNWFKVVWDYFRTPKFDPLKMTNENKSVMAFNLSYLFDKGNRFRDAMEKILLLMEKGVVKPPSIAEFALENVADAHKALESGKTVGKLVLTI